MPLYERTYETFWGAGVPGATGFGAPVVVANQFRFDLDGVTFGMRYYRDSGDNGDHIGFVRNGATGAIERVFKFHKHDPLVFAASGWETAYFSPRLKVAAGDIWQFCLHSQSGIYGANAGALAAADVTHGNITAQQNTVAFFNGSYTYAADLVPSNDSAGDLYGVDPIYFRP